MGNSLRCCLACVLPCGAFDLIRIVHLNGRIEEYSRPVAAREVLAAHPNYVLSRPCSQGGVRRILIVAPDSELKRGHFYFLVPASSVPEKKRKQQQKKARPSKPVPTTYVSRDCDSYLTEILSESKSRNCRRKNIRAAVWRPHLQSIPEETS